MAATVRRRSGKQPVSASRRSSAVAHRARAFAAAVFGAQVVWFALPSPSVAGCTNIPDPPVAFGWRRGTIDRAFIAPHDTVRITIDTPGDPTAKTASAIDVDRLNVRVFVKPLTTSEAPRTVLTATGEAERKACWFIELFCPSSRSRTHNVHLSGVAAPGALLLSFDFIPEQAGAGPALVAIAQPGQQIPDSIASEGCDSEAGRALLACIDRIAPRIDGSTPQPMAAAIAAPTPTDLMVLAGDNDFKHICNRGQDCDGKAATVCFTTNPDGDALILMTWSGVLHPPPGHDHREIYGSSSVPAFQSTPGRIRVPNDDFLEAIRPSGGGFGTKPQFIAVDLPDRPNELTLSGRTKKPQSLLHIWRRRLANRCAGGPHANQLCVEDHDCPASTCTGLGASAYFTCTNASDRPCTRDADCPPSGNCGASTCRTATGGSNGVQCKTDADCNTAQGEECGPSLFDFRGRDTDGVVCISREATPQVIQPASPGAQPTPTPTFVGVCDAGANQGQPCSATSQCPPPPPGTPVECVGFRADAGGYE